MLDDLDLSLEKLLRQELPGSVAQQLAISFLPPDPDFPPSSVVPPAVNLFLYDIREDAEARTGDWVLERDPDGTPTGRRPQPTRIACSYLITAWASSSSSDRARDEHRLLGEVVRALVRHRVLPDSVLIGSMIGQAQLPVTSLQPGRLQSIAELWQAAGGRPKAAVTYTVTITADGPAPLEVGPAVIESVVNVQLGVPDR